MNIIRITFAAVCFLAATTTQASASYQMNRLDFLSGDGQSCALHLNNAGQAVGYSVTYNEITNDTRGAFLWDRTSGMVDIRVEGQFDLPGGMNNNGQVVGTAVPDYGRSTGVLREANGELIQLNPLPEGGRDAFAYALNNNGWVVGTSNNYAVLWQDSVVAQMIGGTSTSYSYATDINNNGRISWVESLHENGQWTRTRSYVWSQGSNTLLQPLTAGQNCQAEAINDSGIVVGSSGTHAVAWDTDGSIIADLGIGTAHGINNHGLIVGTAGDSAWLWSIDGTFSVNLGALAGAGMPSEARDINDFGQIVGGAGYNEYQNMEAVLWEPVPVPVPEPSSMLTLVSLTTGFAAFFRRRRS